MCFRFFHFVILTRAFLSSFTKHKAAWGEIQNGQWGQSLKIFHWELGVLLTPKLCGVDRLVPWLPQEDTNGTSSTATSTLETEMRIPLPYKFKPVKYSTNDRPWTVD